MRLKLAKLGNKELFTDKTGKKLCLSGSFASLCLCASVPRYFHAFVFITVILALAAGPSAYAQSQTSSAETATEGRAQQNTGKRLGKLENRVGKIDKRVTTLEEARGSAALANGQGNSKVQPLTVAMVSKKQAVGGGKIGIKLVLEFKNLTSYTINGFSGMLVFKPEGGDIYTRRMAYAHTLDSGETARITMTISSEQARQYLQFIKAKTVKVVLINQLLHE